MTHKLQTRMLVQMLYVSLGSGEEVINAQHFMAFFQEPVCEMRTQKPGPSSH